MEGFVDFLECLARSAFVSVAGKLIGMISVGEKAIPVFDLCGGRVRRDAQGRIEIVHLWRWLLGCFQATLAAASRTVDLNAAFVAGESAILNTVSKTVGTKDETRIPRRVLCAVRFLPCDRQQLIVHLGELPPALWPRYRQRSVGKRDDFAGMVI